jgi:hypothetical protein
MSILSFYYYKLIREIEKQKDVRREFPRFGRDERFETFVVVVVVAASAAATAVAEEENWVEAKRSTQHPKKKNVPGRDGPTERL